MNQKEKFIFLCGFLAHHLAKPTDNKGIFRGCNYFRLNDFSEISEDEMKNIIDEGYEILKKEFDDKFKKIMDGA